MITNGNLMHSQKGAATLVVSLVLLIGVTLIAFTTARTVLTETKQTADSHRSMQAMAAANYAMDYGVNYFEAGGFDQDDDDILDDVDPMVDLDGDSAHDGMFPPPSLSSGTQTTTATVSFSTAAGTRCVPVGTTPDESTGMITAVGFSDDGLGQRTITQCVGPISILNDEGPEMPLISRAEVALTGTANIVNRYTNINIWSGDKVTIGSSSSMSTFIKDSAAGTLTQAELLDADETQNTQVVSSNNLGNGLDIIDEDPTLDTSATDFFDIFFNVTNTETIKNLAKSVGQYYTDITNAEGKSGIIWIEGDQNGGANMGTIDSPAIVIVNGDMRWTGNTSVYGLLYVVGTLEVAGTVDMIGTAVVEGDGVTAGSAAITGNGTLNMIYWQDFLSDAQGDLPGLSAVISGSWTDF